MSDLARDVPTAFWLRPDWSGGSNLRDPGVEPFWMLPPLPFRDAGVTIGVSRRFGPAPLMYGKVRTIGNVVHCCSDEYRASPR